MMSLANFLTLRSRGITHEFFIRYPNILYTYTHTAERRAADRKSPFVRTCHLTVLNVNSRHYCFVYTRPYCAASVHTDFRSYSKCNFFIWFDVCAQPVSWHDSWWLTNIGGCERECQTLVSQVLRSFSALTWSVPVSCHNAKSLADPLWNVKPRRSSEWRTADKPRITDRISTGKLQQIGTH